MTLFTCTMFSAMAQATCEVSERLMHGNALLLSTKTTQMQNVASALGGLPEVDTISQENEHQIEARQNRERLHAAVASASLLCGPA